MILYCDTSALIKRYVEEEGTKDVDALWESSISIATSVVTFAETLAAFSRKLKEGVLTVKEYRAAKDKFKNDYESFIIVPVNRSLNQIIEGLFASHTLRGFDAIHLASALVFKNTDKVNIQFACYDRNLNGAALKEGLVVAIEI